MATEFDIRASLGDLPRSMRDFSVLFSQHAAIAVFSGRPGAVLLDPLTNDYPSSNRGPETVPIDRRGLADLIRDHKLEHVLLRDRGLMDKLRRDFRLVASFGRYALLSSRREAWAAPPRAVHAGVVGGESNQGPVLVGQGYRGRLFPVTMVLRWSGQGPGVLENGCPYRVWVKLQHLVDPASKLLTWQRPIFCWASDLDVAGAWTMTDHTPLELTAGLPGGRYAVEIALERFPEFPANDMPAYMPPDLEWRELPPVDLVVSKRSLLRDVLTGRQRDISFLVQVLASI